MASKRILLAVTGSIAAYRAASLVRRLQQAGHEVQVMMTDAAKEFIGPVTFEALTGRPVLFDSFASGYPHLDAGRAADVLVIAPCTANTLSDLATGRANNVVTATYLAFAGPVVVCPAMNVRMYNHTATQRNLAQIKKDGVTVIDPAQGTLACGDVGEGKLARLDDIVAAI